MGTCWREQVWAKRETLTAMQASEQAQPTGSAGARMALQNCPKLGSDVLVFILPHQSVKECEKVSDLLHSWRIHDFLLGRVSGHCTTVCVPLHPMKMRSFSGGFLAFPDTENVNIIKFLLILLIAVPNEDWEICNACQRRGCYLRSQLKSNSQFWVI